MITLLGRKTYIREIGKDDTAHTLLGYLRSGVTVNSSVAHIAISGMEYVDQVTCLQCLGQSSNENGLVCIKLLIMSVVQATVTQCTTKIL